MNVISPECFGEIKCRETHVRTLAYDKASGLRLHKSFPYTGVALSKSGNTSVHIEEGLITKMENTNNTFVHTTKMFFPERSPPINCIFVNGIYLHPFEFEKLFPEMAVIFALKDFKLSRMWPTFNETSPITTLSNEIFLHEGDTGGRRRFVVGVLELW